MLENYLNNLYLVGNLSGNAKFGTESPLFWENFGSESEFWAPVISSVGNLLLSVGILLEICSLCWKIATSCPIYFLKPSAAD